MIGHIIIYPYIYKYFSKVFLMPRDLVNGCHVYGGDFGCHKNAYFNRSHIVTDSLGKLVSQSCAFSLIENRKSLSLITSSITLLILKVAHTLRKVNM